MCLETVRYA